MVEKFYAQEHLMPPANESEPKQGAEKSRAKKPSPDLPAGCEVLMTARQIAAALGVSLRQVHLMLSAGKYPPCDVKIGRLPRWKIATHNAWLESQCSRLKPKG